MSADFLVRPDHCDGTYDSSCDPSRAQSDIRGVLTSFGKTDLLAYMDIYWKDSGGNDETFWEHEWNKHGTWHVKDFFYKFITISLF